MRGGAWLWLLVLVAGSVRGEPGGKDWIDSPLIGSGSPPANTTTKIYLSTYLDRLISVDDQDYKFQATMFFYMSYIDPRAPAAVADATAAAAKQGNECTRYCENTRIPGDDALCCGTLFVPSLVLRNVDEYPQGRAQPTTITVTPDGVVSVRCTIRSNMYTTLDVKAFPFDRQTLDYHFTLQTSSKGGAIEIVPSAAGTRLYTQGSSDDSSGWNVLDVAIYTSQERYNRQFNDSALKNLVRPSHPDDPAPLVPAPGTAATPYGADVQATLVTVSVLVSRLSLFYGVSIVLPVVLCTLPSLFIFYIDADHVEARIQVCLSLFLSLVAIQWITEASLPRASYIIPSRALIVLSYLVLLFIFIETIIVYNVLNRAAIRARHVRMCHAHAKHKQRAAADRARGGGSRLARLAVAVLPPPRADGLRQRLASMKLSQRGRGRGGGGTSERAAPAKPPCDGSSAPVHPAHDSVGWAEAALASDVDAGPRQASGTAAPDDDDHETAWAAWLAYAIDRVACGTILTVYLVAAILIFAVAYIKSPSQCALAGAERSMQCAGQRSRRMF